MGARARHRVRAAARDPNALLSEPRSRGLDPDDQSHAADAGLPPDQPPQHRTSNTIAENRPPPPPDSDFIPVHPRATKSRSPSRPKRRIEARLHPVAERDRPRRTQTAAEPKADQTQAARNAGEPAGEELPQRQDRPADVNSRRRRGERHRTPRGTRHHRGSADEHYGKSESKQRGLSLSPTQGPRQAQFRRPWSIRAVVANATPGTSGERAAAAPNPPACQVVPRHGTRTACLGRRAPSQDAQGRMHPTHDGSVNNRVCIPTGRWRASSTLLRPRSQVGECWFLFRELLIQTCRKLCAKPLPRW